MVGSPGLTTPRQRCRKTNHIINSLAVVIGSTSLQITANGVFSYISLYLNDSTNYNKNKG